MQLLGVGEGDFEGDDGDIPPGAHVVSVTEEERAAIQRVSPYKYESEPMTHLIHSSRLWVSLVKLSLKLTLRATRMRNLRRITCLKVDLTIKY